MRMEELSESRYLKRADSVENYLLGLIQEYFTKTGAVPEGSMEQIIEKCVSRMSEDLEYDGIGVTGVLLPDDTEPRTGTVNITLEELHGEPKIETKHTAFNVDFGDMKNTACEGDDPRLTDKRDPNPHSHTLNDIQGLEGALSTVNGKVDRALAKAHDHENMSVLNKIIYTGTKSEVDLADLEKGENRFRTRIEEVQQLIAEYNNLDDQRKQEIISAMNELTGSAGSVKNFIEQSNANSLVQAKAYADDKFTAADNAFNTKLASYVKSGDMILAINTLLTNTYTVAGTVTINITEHFTFASEHEYKEISIPQTVLNEITRRNVSLSECIMHATMSYFDSHTNNIQRDIPYIYTDSIGIPIGSLSVKVINESNKIAIESFISDISLFNNELHQSSVTFTFLSKQGVIE